MPAHIFFEARRRQQTLPATEKVWLEREDTRRYRKNVGKADAQHLSPVRGQKVTTLRRVSPDFRAS